MRAIIILVTLIIFGNVDVLQGNAQECLATRLEIGGDAIVTPGASNRIRSAPSTGAEQIGQIPAGEVLQIVEASQCVDGFRWWGIIYGDISGWTVEASVTDYFLEPYSNTTTSENTDTETCSRESSFHSEQFARLITDLPGRLRAEPGLNSEQVGQVNPGDIFLLTDGPVCVDDFNWWQIEIDGLLVWLAEGDDDTNYIEVVTDSALIGITATPEPAIISHSVSWNADGSRLAIATSIGVIIYDTGDWLEQAYLINDSAGSTSAIFSPINPDLLVINGNDTDMLFRFRVYHLSDEGEDLIFERGLMDGPMGGERTAFDIAFSRDGSQLGFGGSSLSVFETENWTETNRVEILAPAGNHFRSLSIYPADLSPGADYGAGSVDREVLQLFDLSGAPPENIGDADPRISVLDRGGRTQQITTIEFSPDGSHLIAGDATGSLQMWELESGTRTSFIRSEEQSSISNQVNDIAFHPDGEQLVTAESDPVGLIRVFTVNGLDPLLVFVSEDNHSNAYAVAYNPDGESLVALLDEVIYLLETTDYTVLEQIVISQN